MQKYIKAGTAHVAVGDALKKDDIRKVLTASTYDFILFSIGASADSDLSLSSSLAHLPTLPPRHTGLIFKLPVPTINPPDLCGSSMRVFLKVFRTMPEEVKATKLIVISSSGLGRKGHEALPLLMKPMYGWMLQVPHVDKLVTERLIGRAAGQPTWGEDSPAEADEVDEQPWLSVAVIRPAFLTDGECQGDDITAVSKRACGGRSRERPSQPKVSRYRHTEFLTICLDSYTVGMGQHGATAPCKNWDENLSLKNTLFPLQYLAMRTRTVAPAHLKTTPNSAIYLS